MNNFFLLLRKELLVFLTLDILFGHFAFSACFSVLYCFLVRQVPEASDQYMIAVLPGFWIVYVLTVFRSMLHQYSEEVKGGIFYAQLKDGFSPESIFYSKLCGSLAVNSILLIGQAIIFIFFLGSSVNLLNLILAYFAYFPSILPLTIICGLASIMCHLTTKQELLMPIISIPLLLLTSIAALSSSEQVYFASSFDFTSYWFKLPIIFGIILFSIGPALFTILAKEGAK